MIRKLYKFSYAAGSIFIILSMLLSIMPAFPANAQNSGSTNTSAGTCNNPVNKNHYVAGDNIVLHFKGYDPNSTAEWSITGQPGGASCDPRIVVASGSTPLDANGDGCVVAYTVQPDDCGEYTIEVNGSKGDAYRVVDEPDPSPSFTLTKSASVASVPFPGGSVTYTIQISNTGNQAITFTQLTDDQAPGIGSCTGLVGTTLAAGASTSCTFTYEVTGAAGSDHNNTFTARATSGQSNLQAQDTASVHIEAPPPPPELGVTVNKTASPTSIQAPGGNITFSVTVTNTSNVAVTLSSLVDNIYGNLNGQGSCVTPQSLAANGDTYSCSFTGAVSGTAGSSHTDTITATIQHSSGSDTGSDSATVTIFEETVVGVDVGKSANPTSVVEPGGNVTFNVSVQNTSNVDATLTTLNDSVFGDLNGQGTCATGGTIVAGGTYNCSFTEFISAAHSNTVTGTINAAGQNVSDSASASVSVTPRPNPTINVTKTANPTSMDVPGGSATFTVTVQNTSAFPVTLNSLVDSIFGNLNGRGTCATGGTIASGATYSCSFPGSVSGDSNNPHNNTVTAQVVDDLGNTGSGTASAQITFNPLPTITVSKTASTNSISELGGNVTFTIQVNNTSGESLTLNSLTDSVFGNLAGRGDCATGGTITAGGSYSCSFTVFLAGSPATPHTNTVTAVASDSDGNQASDSDGEQVGYQDELPSITASKTAFPTSIDEPGGFISFTFQVNNTSQEAVTLDSLTDDVYGDLNGVGDCATGGTIAAGGSYSCTISGQVTGNAGDTHTNTVTAQASDNDGNSTSDQASATVTITNVPTVIEVTKSANPASVAEPGGNVTFTVQIDNLTDEAITLTNLVDDIYGDLNGQGDCSVPQAIAASGSYSCSFTGAVAGDAGALHTNTVTGTATDDEGGSVSDSSSAQVSVTDVQPTIQVTKSASPGSAPAPLAAFTYTIQVQNLSDEEVTLTSLVDDKFGDLNGAGDCLVGGTIAIGGSYSCSFVENIAGNSGDSHTNVVTAEAYDNEENLATAQDDETVVFTSSPELMLVDPCTVGCDQPNVTGQLCNGDTANDYTGTINWTAYVDSTAIGSGSVNGVPAGECVPLSAPTQGEGMYSIVAVLADEDDRTITTSCGPLSCSAPPPTVTPTPVPPVTPPTSVTPPGVFIPVTGMDLSSNGLISMLQNFGFALLSFGLVMQGFALKDRKYRKSVK